MENKKFIFHGSGKEYFGIWIVNIVLTILTLGIYSAWATVRTKKYFYGNTELNGKRFDYHATPVQILIGRIIAIALLGVFVVIQNIYPLSVDLMLPILGVLAIYIVIRSIAFNVNMSSYANVRFRFNGTKQDIWRTFSFIMMPLIAVSVVGAIALILVGNFSKIGFLLFIPLVVAYFLIPFVQAKIANFQLNHMCYGQFKFAGNIISLEYYMAYFASALVLIGSGIVVTLLVVTLGGIGEFTQTPRGGAIFVFSIFIALSYWLALTYARAIYTTLIRNYTFKQVAIEEHLQLSSSLTIKKVFILYLKNLILLIATLGLAIPWIKVMNARFSAKHTSVQASSELSTASSIGTNTSAIADEVAGNFDIDISPGLGV